MYESSYLILRSPGLLHRHTDPIKHARKNDPTKYGKTITFKCTFPGCDLQYRRKEHLNRHTVEHFEMKVFTRSVCFCTLTRK